jgi:hypothetical protein
MTISHIWVKVKKRERRRPRRGREILRAGKAGPSGAGFRAKRYFERFFGLCWFNVEISNFADGGIGTAPWSAISLASILFP